MKKLKTSFEVEITKIEVDDGYYTINYRYRRDGKGWKKDIYDSDFDGRSDKEWQKELENGVALENILQHLFD